MERLENKLLDVPDETRWFEGGRFDTVKVGDITMGRATLEPGWRWSMYVKPKAGTTSCRKRHVGFVVSGRFMVEMDDGSSAEIVAGEAASIPPGHDAWVVGRDEVVFLEFGAAPETAYAGGGAVSAQRSDVGSGLDAGWRVLWDNLGSARVECCANPC